MHVARNISSRQALSESQRLALVSLLADEDPAVYRTVREKLLACGPPAAEWLRPHMTSSDPALRRRARQIVLHFERQAADDHFLAFCLRHGEASDLERGAWLLAQTQYPRINVEAYQAVLDSYASELRGRLASTGEPEDILTVLSQYLCGELGFAGDEEHYYDPRNSFLNEVMDRRLGIPISLSVLFMAVAQRVGLEVEGVRFPGHFLVKQVTGGRELYIDPYRGGAILTSEDCAERYRAMTQGRGSRG